MWYTVCVASWQGEGATGLAADPSPCQSDRKDFHLTSCYPCGIMTVVGAGGVITSPSEQAAGTRFFVTRRPDIFWEQCPLCEEVLAGPFDTAKEAMEVAPDVRSWCGSIGLYPAPVGVLAIRPTCSSAGEIAPRFGRRGMQEPIVDNPTRFSADWIRAHAAERYESLSGHVAPGF